MLATARDLLADRGLDALTMRALAQRLGVSPNALYSHVADKAALIDEILDDALAAVQAPAPETSDAIGGVHALMASTYEVLLTHSDLVPVYLARQGARGTNAQHLGDILLALLARSNVTGPRARVALHVLIVYTIGSAAFATRSPLATDEASSPATADHAAHFDHGLRWILAGITSQQ